LEASLTDAIPPAKLNRFLEDWIGPIRFDADGSLHPLSLDTPWTNPRLV